jgi:hypothetical protein
VMDGRYYSQTEVTSDLNALRALAIAGGRRITKDEAMSFRAELPGCAPFARTYRLQPGKSSRERYKRIDYA